MVGVAVNCKVRQFAHKEIPALQRIKGNVLIWACCSLNHGAGGLVPVVERVFSI